MRASKPGVLFDILDSLGVVSLCMWFVGLFHGPDAKHAFLFFILLSGSIQFYRLKTVPSSWLWNRFFILINRLEVSSGFRNIVFLSAALMSTLLCSLKTFSARYMMFDQGIFNQVLWSIGNGLGFHSSIEAPGNHMLVHLSPTLLFAWPISAIVGYHPIGLVLTSAVCVWGGLYAWVKMARVHPLLEDSSRRKVEVGILLLVLFFDSAWTNLVWGFHESHLAFLFLSWGYYYFLKGNSWLSILVFALAAFSKEQYLLDLSFLGFALAWIDRKSRWRFIVFSGVLLIVFAGYRHWNRLQLAAIESLLPKDYLLDFFKHYFDYLGVSGIGELIKKAITNPFELIGLWWANRVKDGSWLFPFGMAMAFAFGFMKKQRNYFLISLALIPSFTIIYLAKESKLQDHGLQYVMILWPTLFVLSLPGFVQSRFRIPYFHLYAAVVVSVWSGGIDYWKSIRTSFKGVWEQKELVMKVNAISPDESIWSDRLIGTIVNRKTVQTPPYVHFFQNHCPDWVIGTESEVPGWLIELKPICSSEYQKDWSAAGSVGYHRVK